MSQPIPTQILRATILLQSLWQIIATHRFPYVVESVDHRDNDGCGLVIVHKGLQDPQRIFPGYPHQRFVDCPLAVEKAVQAYSTCTESVAFMLPLLIKLLKGHNVAANEIRQVHKKCALEVIMVSHGEARSSMDNCHDLISLTTLNDGQEYAIDLSGTQYGYQVCCLQMHTYQQRMLVDTTTLQQGPPGTCRRFINEVWPIPSSLYQFQHRQCDAVVDFALDELWTTRGQAMRMAIDGDSQADFSEELSLCEELVDQQMKAGLELMYSPAEMDLRWTEATGLPAVSFLLSALFWFSMRFVWIPRESERDKRDRTERDRTRRTERDRDRTYHEYKLESLVLANTGSGCSCLGSEADP
jgi:hypothetical protein